MSQKNESPSPVELFEKFTVRGEQPLVVSSDAIKSGASIIVINFEIESFPHFVFCIISETSYTPAESKTNSNSFDPHKLGLFM